MRADEWSGPAPSYPCGSSRIRRDVCPHFSSADAMNWSIITCQPRHASHSSDSRLDDLQDPPAFRGIRGGIHSIADMTRRFMSLP